MSYFLFVYDRRSGRLLREQAFDDQQAAMSERFREERLGRDEPDVEVAVIGADSRETVMQTHGRYFGTIRMPAA